MSHKKSNVHESKQLPNVGYAYSSECKYNTFFYNITCYNNVSIHKMDIFIYLCR